MRKVALMLGAALAFTATPAQALVGGKATGGDPAIVAIYVGPAQACSGSIIGKNKVLTAGHCVLDDGLLDVPGVSIVFGKDADDFDAREIDVKSWVKHPKFTDAGQGFDVAILTLEEDVNDVTPLLLVDAPIDETAVGTTLRHSGYGESEEDDAFSKGIKHTATYPITKVDPLLVWSGGKDAQTCEGDSGSPALIEVGDTERILGVVSDGPSCHESGNDARVDVPEIHDWIVKTAGLAIATTAPASASGSAPASAETPPPAATTTEATTIVAPDPTPAPVADGCNAGGRSPSGWWLVLLAIRSVVRRRGCEARGAARARPYSVRPS